MIDELIIDSFAGGGGASTGIEMAIGRSVDIAINHDPEAIRMHKTNHPNTTHYCESVWDVDPMKATGGKPVALAWFSPDCKHHSKAKGGKPVDKKIRGLAWVAIRWAKAVRPRVIMLENVEEFQDWGPLIEDKTGNSFPDPNRKGETFGKFVRKLKRLGYEVSYRELRACDYGAPTIRKRLFLIARCDGKPIVWPEPTNGDPNCLEVICGIKKPWRSVSEVIDWTLPCPSIFDTAEQIKKDYGLRAVRPLADKTMKRIARGIQKFIIDNPDPFIVQVNHSGADWHYISDIKDPLHTLTAKNGTAIISPIMIQYHLEKEDGVPRGQNISRPLLTIDSAPRYEMVSAFISRQFGTSTGHELTKPSGTITAVNKSNLVKAFLIKYYGQGTGQKLDEPLGTIVSKDRFGIVTIKGVDYQIADIGMRMLEPHELFAAQGFPNSYIIDKDYTGKKYPKSEQVARCGNAVVPVLAKALVEANLSELCRKEKIAV